MDTVHTNSTSLLLYPRPTKLEAGYTGFIIPPPNKVGGGVYWLYPRPTKLEVGYTGFTLSVRPSVRLSVDDMVSRA